MSETPVFLNAQAAQDAAKFWIIPAPMDDTAEFCKGQAAAPSAVLAASVYLERYDEEIADTPSESHPVHTVAMGDTVTIEALAEQSRAAIDAKAVPVILGGEPGVGAANIKTVAETSEEFTVLHISCAAKLKEGVSGSAGFMRTALEAKNCKRIVQIGVRSLSFAESEEIFGDESKIETFFACDLSRRDDEGWLEDVVQELSTPVVLSIDVSALERTVVPSVGSPEPGGLAWWDLLRLLKKVTSRRRIAAVDVTDLVPIEGDLTGDFAVAKLVHKIMGYMVAAGKMF